MRGVTRGWRLDWPALVRRPADPPPLEAWVAAMRKAGLSDSCVEYVTEEAQS